MYVYIYIHIHICCIVSHDVATCRSVPADFYTKILDSGGCDSGRVAVLRGVALMAIGNFT